MKDPTQHLQFPVQTENGSVSFWIKHQKLSTNQSLQDLKSLIVASVYYSTTEKVKGMLWNKTQKRKISNLTQFVKNAEPGNF